MLELADDGADPGSDRGRGKQRRREQPDHEPGGAAENGATGDVGTAVVLGHVDLAARVAVQDDGPDDLIVAGVLAGLECLEVVGCGPGNRVATDHKNEIVICHHRLLHLGT